MEPIRTFNGFSQSSGEGRFIHLNVPRNDYQQNDVVPSMGSFSTRNVPPELAKYFTQRDPYNQSMDPTKPGRMLFDRESYEKDRRLARYEQATQEFVAHVKNSHIRASQLMGQMQRRIDFVGQSDTRKPYMEMLSGLRLEYDNARNVLLQRENERFQLVGILDSVINEYAEKMQNADAKIREMKDMKRNATDTALSSYEGYSNGVFDNEEVKAAKSDVAEGEAAVLKAKKEGAKKGLPTIEAKAKEAKTKAEAAKTAAARVETRAKTAEEAVKTAEENIKKAEQLAKDITTLQAEIATLNAEIVQLRKDLAKATVDVPVEKAKIIRDYNRDKLIIDNDAASELAILNAVRPRPANLAQQIITINEKQKKKKEDLLEKANGDKTTADKKITTLNDKIANTVGKINADHRSVTTKTTERTALLAGKSIDKLREDAKAWKEDLAKKSADAVKTAAAEKTATKKFDDANKPIIEAQEKVETAKVNLGEQIKLARKAIPGETREYRAVALGAVNAINDEGRHLRDHFRGTPEGVNRMAELIERKTNILTEVVENGNATSLDLRNVFVSIKAERRFIVEYQLGGVKSERITKLLAMERDYGHKLLATLKKETEAAKTPEERYNAYQHELMVLQEFPEIGNERIKILNGLVNANLKSRHDPLKTDTDRTIIRCDDLGVSEPVLQQAIDAIVQEGRFLKRYSVRGERLAFLYEQHGKLSNRLASTRGQVLRTEATAITAGLRNREGRIQTIQDLIAKERELGKGTNKLARQDVDQMKQEEIKALAAETDKEAVAAINNPDRKAKQQGIKVLLDEATLLHTHFNPQSKERVAQLRTGVETLLKKIAEETGRSATLCASNPSAKNFENAFALIASEHSMYQASHALRTVQSQRPDEIAALERGVDAALINSLTRAQEKASATKSVADLDVAQALLTVFEKRIPSFAGELKIPALARVEQVREELSKTRVVSAKKENAQKAERSERAGLRNAENQIEVQGRIDSVRNHLRLLPFDHPEVAAEAGYNPKQLEAQLKADKQQLQESLGLASPAQRKAIDGLIQEIEDAIPERLRTQVENKNTFKGNFKLMVGEIKMAVETMKQRPQNPTVKDFQDRVKANKETLVKAQGYIDVADDYGMAKSQIDGLKDLMAQMQDVVSRDQKVIATYERSKKRPGV